jgi:hypothetical protein
MKNRNWTRLESGAEYRYVEKDGVEVLETRGANVEEQVRRTQDVVISHAEGIAEDETRGAWDARWIGGRHPVAFEQGWGYVMAPSGCSRLRELAESGTAAEDE